MFTLDTRGEDPARVLGRLRRRRRPGLRRLRAIARRRVGEPRRTCASTRSFPGPIRSPLRDADASGRRQQARCRRPKRSCRSICICSAGQPKAESGHGHRRAGVARRSAGIASLLPRSRRDGRSAASRAGGGNRRPAACPASTRTRAGAAARRPAARRSSSTTRRHRCRRGRRLSMRRPDRDRSCARRRSMPTAQSRGTAASAAIGAHGPHAPASDDRGERTQPDVPAAAAASIASGRAWRRTRAISAQPTRDGAGSRRRRRRRLHRRRLRRDSRASVNRPNGRVDRRAALAPAASRRARAVSAPASRQQRARSRPPYPD